MEQLDSKHYEICRNTYFWGYIAIEGNGSFDVYEHDHIVSEDEYGNRYEGVVEQDGCTFFLDCKEDSIPLCDLVPEKTTILGTTLKGE